MKERVMTRYFQSHWSTSSGTICIILSTIALFFMRGVFLLIPASLMLLGILFYFVTLVYDTNPFLNALTLKTQARVFGVLLAVVLVLSALWWTGNIIHIGSVDDHQLQIPQPHR